MRGETNLAFSGWYDTAVEVARKSDDDCNYRCGSASLLGTAEVRTMATTRLWCSLCISSTRMVIGCVAHMCVWCIGVVCRRIHPWGDVVSCNTVACGLALPRHDTVLNPVSKYVTMSQAFTAVRGATSVVVVVGQPARGLGGETARES